MNFIQRKKFQTQDRRENVLIPFIDDADLREQIRYITPQVDPEELINLVTSLDQDQLMPSMLLPVENGTVAITFMKLSNGKELDYKLLHDRFAAFGKRISEDYQILLEGLRLDKSLIQRFVKILVRAISHGAYTFVKEMLTQLTDQRLYSLRKQMICERNFTVTIVYPGDLTDSISEGREFGECISYARMLGDLPNNYLHVKQFAQYMEDFAKEYQLPCEILGRKELEELHSGGILGVNAGNSEEPKLITVYYEGCKCAPVIALVGKGVMFDSGGYHLKSISGMQGMKYDMCGAANMAAAFEIAVRRKSKRNILLVIPAVENLIGPGACKMGDVLTTMSGKTVEVYNIDAEGRLILCDALTYAIQKGAECVIDLATLTYSCQKALGNEISGIYSNQDEFLRNFEVSTKEQGEKVWRLPLDDAFRRLLYRTQTADLINYAPDSEGGSNVAACFLEEFIDESIPWIHMDIVGTSVNRSESSCCSKGATGVMAASVAAYLLEE